MANPPLTPGRHTRCHLLFCRISNSGGNTSRLPCFSSQAPVCVWTAVPLVFHRPGPPSPEAGLPSGDSRRRGPRRWREAPGGHPWRYPEVWRCQDGTRTERHRRALAGAARSAELGTVLRREEGGGRPPPLVCSSCWCSQAAPLHGLIVHGKGLRWCNDFTLLSPGDA